MNDWLNERQAADYLGISPRSVRNLRKRRVLAFVKIGKIVRYSKKACEAAYAKFETHSV